MKVKLIIKDEDARRILRNAESTARRVEQWPAWKRNAPQETQTEPINNVPIPDDNNT